MSSTTTDLPDRKDELPFGREAHRGIFVEGMEIVVRGADEWVAEAARNGSATRGDGGETHRHWYVESVFAESRRDVARLGAECVGALNQTAARTDSAVAETVNAQADLRDARAAHKEAVKHGRNAEQAVRATEKELAITAGKREAIAEAFPLVFAFALEGVLLWLALQKVELGAAWIRWVVVVLVAGLITFIAHRVVSWITADWDREPQRRRFYVMIAGGYALCVGVLLVALAYVRLEDITFASRSISNLAHYRLAFLAILFFVSVMGSIFAGYSGYRHGRAGPLREAVRGATEARRKEKSAASHLTRAELRERAASEVEEAEVGRLDAYVDCYARALTQVQELAVEVGNRCLRAESAGFTIEEHYRKKVKELRDFGAEMSSSFAKRQEEILAALDDRRGEVRGHHA